MVKLLSFPDFEYKDPVTGERHYSDGSGKLPQKNNKNSLIISGMP